MSAKIVLFCVLVVALMHVSTGCWRHHRIDGKLHRAWHIEAPGYTSPYSFNGGKTEETRFFTWYAYYRITPWFETDYGC